MIRYFALSNRSSGKSTNEGHYQSTENRLLIALLYKGRGKKTIFLGLSPKLWVGGGQES